MKYGSVDVSAVVTNVESEVKHCIFRQGDPSQITLTHEHGFIMAIKEIAERLHITA